MSIAENINFLITERLIFYKRGFMYYFENNLIASHNLLNKQTEISFTKTFNDKFGCMLLFDTRNHYCFDTEAIESTKN